MLLESLFLGGYLQKQDCPSLPSSRSEVSAHKPSIYFSKNKYSKPPSHPFRNPKQWFKEQKLWVLKRRGGDVFNRAKAHFRSIKEIKGSFLKVESCCYNCSTPIWRHRMPCHAEVKTTIWVGRDSPLSRLHQRSAINILARSPSHCSGVHNEVVVGLLFWGGG